MRARRGSGGHLAIHRSRFIFAGHLLVAMDDAPGLRSLSYLRYFSPVCALSNRHCYVVAIDRACDLNDCASGAHRCAVPLFIYIYSYLVFAPLVLVRDGVWFRGCRK